MSWQQRFEKVHDALELRVGNSQGPLIYWPDRGRVGDRQFTWSWQDPVPEIRDISQWVGSNSGITLWARIHELPHASGDHQCDMDTLLEGVKLQRWEFDEDEAHTINSDARFPFCPANQWTTVIEEAERFIFPVSYRVSVTDPNFTNLEIKTRRYGVGVPPYWESSFRGSDTFSIRPIIDIYTRIDIQPPVNLNVMVLPV